MDRSSQSAPCLQRAVQADAAADVGGVFLSSPGNPAGQQVGGVAFSGPNNYNGIGVFSGTK